jgi:hypothetical protein
MFSDAFLAEFFIVMFLILQGFSGIIAIGLPQNKRQKKQSRLNEFRV